MKTVPQTTAIIALATIFLACATKVESVALDKSNLTIAVGDSAALMALIQPENASDQAVTWKIDYPSLATLSTDGTITATSLGKATVTVTTKDGGHTAACALTIIPNVSLDNKAVSLNVGDTQTLIASTRPENAIESGIAWSSSDNAVATVSGKGMVKAVAQGTATITATASDGGKTASCNLTIVQPVKSVSLDRTALTLEKGSSRTLNARINPADATNQKLKWSSSDTSIAKVSNDGEVEAIGKGRATITVTTDDREKTAKCNVTVVISDTEWIQLVEHCVQRVFLDFVLNYDFLKDNYSVRPDVFYYLDYEGSRYVMRMEELVMAFRRGHATRGHIVYFHEQQASTLRSYANRYRNYPPLNSTYNDLIKTFDSVLEEIR